MNKSALMALLGTSLFVTAAARAETKSTGKTATSASKHGTGAAAVATPPATSATKSTTAPPVGTPPSTAATAAGTSSAPSTAAAGTGATATTTTTSAATEASATTAAVGSDGNAVSEDPNSPFEKRDTTYRFVGARFRYVIVPKFYMGLFGDGGTTVGVPAFGPEFTIRRNGFEYVFSAMYASYAMSPTPFKAKTDPVEAWEIVETNIKALYLMSDFLWSSEVSPKFAINYGAGFGLAVVLGGDIHRQQAMPGSGGEGDPNSYVPCPSNSAGTGPGGGNGRFCTPDNNHYGNYSEPSWADGGSKPIIFPWLSVQTGFRWKPVKQFAARVDIGWNLLNGPFFGLAANYGL